MEQATRRKNNRRMRPSFPWHNPCSSSASLMAFISFISSSFFFFLFFSVFRIPFPWFTVDNAPLVSTLTRNSASSLPVQARVVFPDHLLLLVKHSKNTIPIHGDLYYCSYPHSSQVLPVLSVDHYDRLRWIARCPLPPYNKTTSVDLRRGGRRGGSSRRRLIRSMSSTSTKEAINPSFLSWQSLAYAASVDGDTAVVFVKGLNLRPDKKHHDPSHFSCHFRSQIDDHLQITSNSVALTAAQEVIRCPLPEIVRRNFEKGDANGVSVSVGVDFSNSRVSSGLIPSVAMVSQSEMEEAGERKYQMCICTMLWNQASHIREWIIYHGWLGVERWFIYDNNSEDDIEKVISELNSQGYRVSRHVWPWLKSQEAGFSHCALRSVKQCSWVGFLDVDEFFHIHGGSGSNKLEFQGENSLRKMISNLSSSSSTMEVGEIRTSCLSFGPSGHRRAPPHGVISGYTCRLVNAERHKSIVRPEALDETLMNVVHHFRLREGFGYVNMAQSSGVINHYKYQAWEVFRAKFYRRVATYVVDWQRDENQGSKDRAPGLGKEAIEPPDWALRFCEVWDTGLRDFVTFAMADPATRALPWAAAVFT